MSKVLVTYATNSSSTAEVAETIANHLNETGHIAVLKSIQDVSSIDSYDAIVVGAPMIFGWHKAARGFLKNHHEVLVNKKVAYFACAMRLTQVPGEKLADVSLTLDPSLAAAPQKAGSLSIKERFSTIGYYLKPMINSAPNVKPINIAFFNGKLETFRLKWWEAAFVMIVVQAVPGDYRNWDQIKAWSQSVSRVL